MLKLNKKIKRKFEKRDNLIQNIKDGKQNFLFFHINKTAGTSIAKGLSLPKFHFSVREMKPFFTDDEWNSIFKFTVIRNPYDRLVSLFEYRIKTENISDQTSFEDFVLQVYLKYKQKPQINEKKFESLKLQNNKINAPQVNWLEDNTGKINMDFIIRFEELDEGIKQLEEKIGRNIPLEKLNETNRKPYKLYYNSITKAITEEWFKRDFDAFNYPIESDF